MQTLRPSSASRTGTGRSRKRLGNQTLSSRIYAGAPPAPSPVQWPECPPAPFPSDARRLAQDLGEKPPTALRNWNRYHPLPTGPRSPPWAAPSINRFSPEPKLGRSFTPGACRAAPRSPRSRVAEPRSSSRTRSQSCEDADKAWRLGVAVAAEVAAMVAAAAEGSGATYPAGARPGRAGTEQVEPGPPPEPGREGSGEGQAAATSVRPPPPLPPRRAARRPRGRGRASGSTLPRQPPPRAPSFFLPPSRLPVSSVAARGRRRRLRGHSRGSCTGSGIRRSSSSCVPGRARAPATPGKGSPRADAPTRDCLQAGDEMPTGLEHRPGRTPGKTAGALKQCLYPPGTVPSAGQPSIRGLPSPPL